MARAKTSPAARLEALKRLKPRLRRFKKDETLSAKPMAEFLGVTWVVLRGWCDEFDRLDEADAYVRGGNGVEWVFRPRATLTALIAEFEAQLLASRARSRRIRDQVAGDQAAAIPEDFSLDEMRKQLDISSRLRAEREASGELVRAADVREKLQRTLSAMRDAGLRTLQKLDPNGRWTPEQRELAQEIATAILVDQESAATTVMKELNGGAA